MTMGRGGGLVWGAVSSSAEKTKKGNWRRRREERIIMTYDLVVEFMFETLRVGADSIT